MPPSCLFGPLRFRVSFVCFVCFVVHQNASGLAFFPWLRNPTHEVTELVLHGARQGENLLAPGEGPG